MIKFFVLFCLMFFCAGARAFPTGSFECGSGTRTVAFDISSIAVNSETLPYLNVRIRQPDLESDLQGFGMLLKITDKKTGEVERRVSLAGSNFSSVYSKNDEIELVENFKNCHRK